MRDRWIAFAFLVFTSIYFPDRGAGGTRTGNLGFYSFQHPSDLVKADLFYFSPAYRPAGALFYRPLFEKFGLFSPPYRVVCFLLLVANLWLAFLAMRAFTGSMEVAAIAILIAAFHPRFRDLYTSSGTIYDILCFTFYFGAGFIIYSRAVEDRSVASINSRSSWYFISAL